MGYKHVWQEESIGTAFAKVIGMAALALAMCEAGMAAAHEHNEAIGLIDDIARAREANDLVQYENLRTEQAGHDLRKVLYAFGAGGLLWAAFKMRPYATYDKEYVSRY